MSTVLNAAPRRDRPRGFAIEPIFEGLCFAAAAAGAKWNAAPGFYLLLLDQPGANAWPITGATFILMHSKQTNAQAGHDSLAFFDWAYKNGDAAAAALDYVTFPDAVKTLVRKSWKTIVGPDGKPVYK